MKLKLAILPRAAIVVVRDDDLRWDSRAARLRRLRLRQPLPRPLSPLRNNRRPLTPDWTEPFPPFRIAGNLYYVGSKGLANYLITTPQGNILINSDTEANVPMIKASIEKLGFKFSDTKILLISHAHWDHDAGSATGEERNRREIHGDGCRCAGGRVRRQNGF